MLSAPRLVIAFAMSLLVIPGLAFAQSGTFDDPMDTIGEDFGPSWDFSYSEYGVWDNGEYWDKIQNHFFFDESGSEPIEEIEVRAKRWRNKQRAANRLFAMEFRGQFDFLALDQFSRRMSEDCAHLMSADPLAMCEEEDEEQCQTVSITIGPFTQQQASDYNVQLLQLDEIQETGTELTVGALTGFTTSLIRNEITGLAVGTLSMVGVAALGFPDSNELNPFSAGDVFEITQTACPAGTGNTPNVSTVVRFIRG